MTMSGRADAVGGTVDAPIWPLPPTEPSSGVGPASNHHKQRMNVPGWPRRSFLPLAPLPTAIACARGHTLNVLAEWGLHELADDAALLVSEMMTNAYEASASLPEFPPIVLQLLANETTLVIQAWDQSPDDLKPQEVDDDSECGRGLLVVQALSQRWGVERTGYRRKVVWCELRIDQG
jgi:anti-sigma regulatory factor (Ser/Thr protein kinase)